MANKVKSAKLEFVLVELGHHLPYTIFGVALGLMLMGIMTFLAILMRAEDRLPAASGEFFHVAHASHILFSAVATTAMFWKHEKRIGKALAVGFLGSIGVCALSDSVFPTIGGTMLGMDMRMHICVLEHPFLILPFAGVGVMGGFLIPGAIERSTEYSHSVHVLLSSISAILYLIAFGMIEWIHMLGGIFLITVVSVMLPCCLSGIVLPLWCAHRNCNHG